MKSVARRLGGLKKPPPSAGFHPKARVPCLLGAVFIPDGWRWMERRLRRRLRKRVGPHAPRRHAPSSGAVARPLAPRPRSVSARQRLPRPASRFAPYRASSPHPSRTCPPSRARPAAPRMRRTRPAPRPLRCLPRSVAQRRPRPRCGGASGTHSVLPESAQINSNFPYLVKIFLDGLRFTSYLSQLHFFADSRILLKEERPRGPRKNR